MWTNIIKACGVAFILISTNSFATSQSQCDVRLISLEPVSARSTYDVFSTAQSPLVQHYQLRADIAQEGCSVSVELDIGEGSNQLRGNAGQDLGFEWSGTNGFIRGGRWLVTLTHDEPITQFQLRYPSGQWLTSGAFHGQMTANVIESGSNTSASLSNSKELTLDVEADVIPSAKIQFYGLSQRHYDLDLGELNSSKIIHSGPKLWVQSTSEYVISFESENLGHLRHDPADRAWDIAYQIMVNSETVPLETANSQWRSSQSTQGQTVPMSFVIGDVGQKPGGSYKDILHISIEPDLSQSP